MNLRNPKFGNVFIENTQAVKLTTIDGEVDIYKSDDWQTIKTFEVSFEAFSAIEAENIRLFFLASAAQEIEIDDHEANTWTGFIVDPDPQIVQEGRGCRYSTSFVFEGELVP